MSVGWSWFWQCDVVQTRSGSQVFMYRMRRAPWPSRVTSPPPSITMSGRLLKTRAVALIGIVTGDGPQLNVMIPPWATALTTACEVQLPGRSGPDHAVRVGGVDEAGRGGDRRVPGRVAGRRSRRVDRRQSEGSLEERGHLASCDVALRAEPAATAARRDAGRRQPVDREPERMAGRDVAEAHAARGDQVKRTREERGHLAAADEVVRAEPAASAAGGNAGGRQSD